MWSHWRVDTTNIRKWRKNRRNRTKQKKHSNALWQRKCSSDLSRSNFICSHHIDLVCFVFSVFHVAHWRKKTSEKDRSRCQKWSRMNARTWTWTWTSKNMQARRVGGKGVRAQEAKKKHIRNVTSQNFQTFLRIPIPTKANMFFTIFVRFQKQLTNVRNKISD